MRNERRRKLTLHRTFFVQGSIAVAGSAVKWLRDSMGVIKEAEEINTLADSVKDNGGVVFVTAFSGLFAPYWRPDVRGCILGISQHTTKGHLARATLEATCFQTRAVSAKTKRKGEFRSIRDHQMSDYMYTSLKSLGNNLF